MRWRVSSRTRASPFRASDAVEIETLASRAMSRMVLMAASYRTGSILWNP
jgi:hypothetical protein